MRVILDVVRMLGCLIFCALLVLLAPSSAYSADGETPSSEPSPSSSPAPESASPSADPTSSDSPSPSPSTSPSGQPVTSSPSPDPAPESTAPEPSAPETVYVVTEPPAPAEEQTTLAEGETVVTLSDDDRALVGLAACLLALGVGARIVGSFA